MKKFLSIILVLGIILGAYYFFSNREAKQISQTNYETPGLEEGLRLYSLLPNMLISSPLTIIGSIPGPWYFEGSFPVSLEDGAGNIMATSIAQAQSDWMIEGPVQFLVDISFNNDNNLETAYLVFKKDNPSGLPENDKSIMWPVRLK